MKSKQWLNRFLMIFLICYGTNGMSQAHESGHNFYFDYVMGPYLFVSHIPYDAVMMNGGRLGYELSPKFDCSIEYVVGQQHDDQHTLGMTHNVNGQLAWFLKERDNRFNPYLFTGGGFMEFKSFTEDVYGVQFHIGMGSTIKFAPRIHGLFEARYFNLAQMDLGGVHELAVFWGLRAKF